jgi:cleavage stimulation factor subunit 3
MEIEREHFNVVEAIFGRSIQTTPYIGLWSAYINYIRRRNNLTTDQTGAARTVIVQVYEFVLDNVGIDPEAGQIWKDYIEVLKSGPGILGGSNWQDLQKMDTVRKVYQRAIAVPTHATMDIWKDYDRFEMNLNKATVREIQPWIYKAYSNNMTGPKAPSGSIIQLHDGEKCRPSYTRNNA